MSDRLSPKLTTAVKVPSVVGAPEGWPVPGTSGSLPPQAANSAAAKAVSAQDRMFFMRSPLACLVNAGSGHCESATQPLEIDRSFAFLQKTISGGLRLSLRWKPRGARPAPDAR